EAQPASSSAGRSDIASKSFIIGPSVPCPSDSRDRSPEPTSLGDETRKLRTTIHLDYMHRLSTRTERCESYRGGTLAYGRWACRRDRRRDPTSGVPESEGANATGGRVQDG